MKRFLEKLGFAVKGEIHHCDVVGLRAEDPPVVVITELKRSFTLELVLQAVERMAAADEIWLAVALSRRGRGRERDPRVRKLCRLLGLGLLGVARGGLVEIIAEPGPWRPRRDKAWRSQIVSEHRRRHGDPVPGGSTRAPIMTAYRQQALLCAAALAQGPRTTRDVRALAPDGPKILLDNVYGWFTRLERGIYALTDAGQAALLRWPVSLEQASDPSLRAEGEAIQRQSEVR